jgi:DNA-binding PadR family transcriptional regulator
MDNDRELLLLGILRQQEMHGYQLHEFIDSNLAACTDLKKSTAYYLLDKMSATGWVAYEETKEGNRPPRRVYRLTAEGEAAFQALLRENLASYVPVRFSGDVGLAFAEALPPHERLDLLTRRRSLLQAELDAVAAAPAHAGGIQLIVDHRRHHLAAELAWLDEVVAGVARSAVLSPRS